ncbi:hypothetical protein SLEP1_g5224 [Rubroshorea leprosula]|uniref:Reverse transcriptase domain-containing protein n=1 Tax=Rubroshorea leprosula TaxID=152421 RepID=A0AAV5I076_9ROSI|nr:hypothetical protein SLEP1_g5224 [Rubroshorea leprosula]
MNDNQSAFVKGRQLMDSVIVPNETIDEAKKKRKRIFIFKADFEKAYDNVCWDFLDSMLSSMGFGDKWRQWIKECLASSSVSILLNGSATREFKISKGLRQGDPLSPFLFLIIAEGLNGIINYAVEHNLFKGVAVGKGSLMITHLQFADDTILFEEATEENMKALKGIMRTFELVSGLKINYNKSQLIGVNVKEEEVSKMSHFLNCNIGELPMKYLGMMIGMSTRRLKMWKGLIDKFKKKLSGWNNKYLSLGGRIVLINSVLTSLPVFLMSTYLLPKGVIKAIDTIRRGFLWGGKEEGKKIAWVGWDKVCKGKEDGGLGIKDLRLFNLALLGKWWGRLGDGSKGLWKRVLEERYGKNGTNWHDWMREGRNISSNWWRDICSINWGCVNKEEWLELRFSVEVGEGNEVSFWRDVWVGNGCLKEKFPRLYLLFAGKGCTINEMGHWEGDAWRWCLNWRRHLLVREAEQVTELMEIIQGIQLRKGVKDSWRWAHDKGGNYNVKSAYALLARDEALEGRKLLKKCWNPTIPSKVCAFTWLVLQHRIPCKINLIKRNITKNGEEDKCGLCKKYSEDTNHLMLECDFVYSLWMKCAKWWGVSHVMHQDCKAAFDQHSGVTNARTSWLVIWFAVTWTIWVARNDAIFNDKQANVEDGLELVRRRSYLWISGNKSDWNFSFTNWCQDPNRCLILSKSKRK